MRDGTVTLDSLQRHGGGLPLSPHVSTQYRCDLQGQSWVFRSSPWLRCLSASSATFIFAAYREKGASECDPIPSLGRGESSNRPFYRVAINRGETGGGEGFSSTPPL